MSSNELHITRANYEEFFLLYVDGELTAAQNDAVEAFAAQHPDLQEELDILLTTKLDAEPVFFNKESLLADNMKHSAIDESLLLYIDDELNDEEKKVVEEKIANDTTYQFQHNLLLQTKLPAVAISYPDKAELYRKEERTIRPVLWYRIAAAIFVLMASGYMWSLTNKAIPDSDVAIQSPATLQKTGTINQPSTTDPSLLTTQDPVMATTIDNNKNEVITSTSKQTPVEVLKQHSAPIASRTPDTRVETSIVKTTAVTISTVTENSTASNQQQHIINKQAVTTPPAIAYNPIEDATDNLPGQSDAVAIETENNKKGGSVKGFLRKATRFIERRTGVSATNENDELLIGALAINLK